MKVQAEGDFKSLPFDMGDSKDVFFIFFLFALGLLIAATYFTVRLQGINKENSGWVLGALIVMVVMMVFRWSSAYFSNYNWSDWASEVVGLG
jgi:hypothetical protein